MVTHTTNNTEDIANSTPIISKSIRAQQLFSEHIELAHAGKGKEFRRIILNTLVKEYNCTISSAATAYNSAKKNSPPIEGLGRPPIPSGVVKFGTDYIAPALQDENECFTVVEVINGNVCRSQSFLMQGDCSEEFDMKVLHHPKSNWYMIKGLGPNPIDNFILEEGEEIIKTNTND